MLIPQTPTYYHKNLFFSDRPVNLPKFSAAFTNTDTKHDIIAFTDLSV